MEMPKKIYLETLKSALGRSILHYSHLSSTLKLHHSPTHAQSLLILCVMVAVGFDVNLPEKRFFLNLRC